MRAWEPEDKSPLPSAGDKYLQYETAVYWHLDMDEWEAKKDVSKAKMMAHYLHKRIREGFLEEHYVKKMEKKGKKKVADDGGKYLTLDDLMNFDGGRK